VIEEGNLERVRSKGQGGNLIPVALVFGDFEVHTGFGQVERPNTRRTELVMKWRRGLGSQSRGFDSGNKGKIKRERTDPRPRVAYLFNQKDWKALDRGKWASQSTLKSRCWQHLFGCGQGKR